MSFLFKSDLSQDLHTFVAQSFSGFPYPFLASTKAAEIFCGLGDNCAKSDSLQRNSPLLLD